MPFQIYGKTMLSMPRSFAHKNRMNRDYLQELFA